MNLKGKKPETNRLDSGIRVLFCCFGGQERVQHYQRVHREEQSSDDGQLTLTPAMLEERVIRFRPSRQVGQVAVVLGVVHCHSRRADEQRTRREGENGVDQNDYVAAERTVQRAYGRVHEQTHENAAQENVFWKRFLSHHTAGVHHNAGQAERRFSNPQ